MRLIGYYVLHTFINNFKKLFKTWFIIFIGIIILFGVGFGFLLDTVLPEDDIEIDPSASIEEVIDEPLLNLDEKTMLFEVVALVVTVLIITLIAFNADKNGNKIFQPADVALLFSSPLKPQFVLLFRMIGQIMAFLFAGIYMLFQIPNLINGGFPVLSGIGLFVTYFLVLSFGELFSVLIYSITTSNGKYRKLVKPLVLSVPVGLIIYFGIYYISVGGATGDELFYVINDAFNFAGSRWIPILGNLKGMFAYSLENNLVGFLLEILYAIVSLVALIFIIWTIDCDFYEDALKGSEETAELMESAERGMKLRNKPRSEKIRRNELRHGWGANALFFKEVYNRFRFAKLGFLTNTMITYLSICVPLMILLKFIIKVDTFFVISLTLGGMAFYRTLGDSIHQDIDKPFFILIPEKTRKKFFYSMISGTFNCAMDILPILIISEILDLGNAYVFLLSFIFIVSLNFYSQSIGSFLDLSIMGKNTGKNIKVLIQLLFIYFGLVPDIIVFLVLTLGFDLEFTVVMPYALLCATIVNVILGLPFLFTAPLFIDPKVGKKTGKGEIYQYEGR